METDMAYAGGKKLFDFKLIGIGFVFLIDFNLNTVDILPDFIALILISAGIGKACYINENLSKTKNYINVFYIVALFKFAWNIIYVIMEFKGFDNSFILLLTALFATTELILSLLIFTNIFKGLEIFFHQSGKIEYAKKSDFIIGAIKFFFVLKFLMTLLVQLPVLLTDINLDNISMIFDVYVDVDFIKNLFMPPCFIILSLIGIFLLSLIIPFFLDVGKDKTIYEFVKSKINRTFITDNFFALKQSLNSAFMLFMAGCLFFVDFQVDNINFLPDFIICVIFLSGVLTVLRTNPEIKNTKLNLYLVINLFVSVIAYIMGTVYKIKYSSAFIGENVTYFRILRLSSDILFHISVILFFLIFIEFYSFVRDLQRKHLEFSIRYFNKYITSSEKNFDKNRNKIILFSSFAFIAKTLSTVLPQSGIVKFCHSMILVAFVFITVKGLYSIRDSVYSYYN